MVKKILLFCAAVILAAVIVIFLIPGKSGKSLPWGKDRQKKYANTLIDRGLYLQAVAEYQKLLDSGNLNDGESANLSYLIGSVCMENLRDYENALAAYLKVKIYDKDTKLEQELNQRIVECLERTGRSFEAQKEMDKLTLLKKPKEISRGTVVAKLGKREITMKELEEQIRNLPPYIQEMYKSKDKQLEFLKQYVATELLYDAAKRRNYDKNKDIVEQTFQIKKSLMVGKLMQEEIKDKIKVSDSEIKLYYEAHKEDFVEKTEKDKKGRQKSLEEVKNDIHTILQSEKEREAQQELISKMFAAERAEIYEDLFSKR